MKTPTLIALMGLTASCGIDSPSQSIAAHDHRLLLAQENETEGDGPEAPPETPVPTPDPLPETPEPEAPEPEIDASLLCGDLCLPGDHIDISLPRFVSFNDDETVFVPFDANEGDLTWRIESWGNYGTENQDQQLELPDGITVTVTLGLLTGDPCPSDYRISQHPRGCRNLCNGAGLSVLGPNVLQVNYHKDGGHHGWSVDTSDSRLTYTPL